MKKHSTTVGIIAYITLIGFIIALMMNAQRTGEEKRFGAFHLRQALGLGLTQFVILIVANILSKMSIITLSSNLIGLLVLILAIIGILNASRGEMKELPVIGAFIKDKLGNAFD